MKWACAILSSVACPARGAYGGEERGIQGFWWGKLRERDHLGDPDVDGREILTWIFRKWDVGGYGLDPADSG